MIPRRKSIRRKLPAVLGAALLCAVPAPAFTLAAAEARAGKVLIASSADMLKNEFLVQGGDYSAAVHLLFNALDSFCLDPRLLSIPRDGESPSPTMKALLGELKGGIAITYYSSKSLPESLKDLKGKTEAYLRQLAAAAPERIQWQAVDPDERAAAVSKDADQLSAFYADLERRGIHPILTLESGELLDEGKAFFSAIELRSGNRPVEVLGVHRRVDQLEIELARRVLKLTGPAPCRVFFWDGTRGDGGTGDPASRGKPTASDYSAIMKSIDETYGLADDLRKELAARGGGPTASGAAPGEAAPPFSCLVIAQPHDIEERAAFEIARLVSEGVPSVFLVSGYTIDVSERGLRGGFPLTELRPVFDAVFRRWGVVLGADLVASRACDTLPLPQPPKGNQPAARANVPLPVLPKAAGDGLLKSHPLLTGVTSLVFPAAVGLTVNEEAVRRVGLKATLLSNSGKESYTVRFSRLVAGKSKDEPVPFALKTKELSDVGARKDGFGEPRTLAVLLEGKFPFAFQGQSPPEWKK